MRLTEYKRSTSALRYILNNPGNMRYKFRTLSTGRPGHRTTLVLNGMNRTVIAAINTRGDAVRYRPNSQYAQFFRDSGRFKYAIPSDTLNQYRENANGNYGTLVTHMHLTQIMYEIEDKKFKLPMKIKLRGEDFHMVRDYLTSIAVDRKWHKLVQGLNMAYLERGKIVIPKPEDIQETTIMGIRPDMEVLTGEGFPNGQLNSEFLDTDLFATSLAYIRGKNVADSVIRYYLHRGVHGTYYLPYVPGTDLMGNINETIIRDKRRREMEGIESFEFAPGAAIPYHFTNSNFQRGWVEMSSTARGISMEDIIAVQQRLSREESTSNTSQSS